MTQSWFSLQLLTCALLTASTGLARVEITSSFHARKIVLAESLQGLKFRTQQESQASIGKLKSYIERVMKPILNTNDLKMKFVSVQYADELSPLTSVRFEQFVQLDKGALFSEATQVPVKGGDVVALIGENAELVSLNSGLIKVAQLPSSERVFDLSLSHLSDEDRYALLSTFGKNPTKAFFKALDYLTSHSKQPVSQEMKNSESFVKAREVAGKRIILAERIRRIGKILQATGADKRMLFQLFTLVRLHSQKAAETRITQEVDGLEVDAKEGLQLIVNKLPFMGYELLWRMKRPFDIPVIIDFNVTNPNAVKIARVESLFEHHNRLAEITILQAQSDFPTKSNAFKKVVSFKSNTEVPAKMGFLNKTPAEVKDLAETIKTTLTFFETRFRWNSYDNLGSELKVFYDIKYEGLDENAAWAPSPYNFFLFGAGGKLLGNFTRALDVVGHEFTHAIISATSRLGDSGQQAALNEHVSDIMGLALYNNMTLKSEDMTDFKMGKGVLSEKARREFSEKRGKQVVSIRDLLDPKASLSAQVISLAEATAKYGRFCYPSKDNDKCGAHEQAGIPNLAVANIIKQIGWSNMSEMFYVVITKRLRSDSDFLDYKRQLENQCEKTSKIQPTQCQIIRSEFLKVGIVDPEDQAEENQAIIEDEMKSGNFINDSSCRDLYALMKRGGIERSTFELICKNKTKLPTEVATNPLTPTPVPEANPVPTPAPAPVTEKPVVPEPSQSEEKSDVGDGSIQDPKLTEVYEKLCPFYDELETKGPNISRPKECPRKTISHKPRDPKFAELCASYDRLRELKVDIAMPEFCQ